MQPVMTFTTVFDIAQEGYANWWFPAFGLIGLTVGALLVFMPDLMRTVMPGGLQGRARVLFSWCFFIFALLWTTGTFASTYLDYRAMTHALDQGRYEVVEGPVTDFVPGPENGHGNESFSVQGRRFAYADAVVVAGFHRTTSHGGPIRQGLYVRIAYSGSEILRLEVRR